MRVLFNEKQMRNRKLVSGSLTREGQRFEFKGYHKILDDMSRNSSRTLLFYYFSWFCKVTRKIILPFEYFSVQI